MRQAVLCLSILLAAAPPFVAAAAKADRCLDLKKPHATATVSGVLTARLFAGPPDFESVAGGDAMERALILELPRAICADDGEFIDGTTQIDRVQVSSTVPSLLDELNAAVGRQVTLSGEAFGAQSGHHHAPLVLFADKITGR